MNPQNLSSSESHTKKVLIGILILLAIGAVGFFIYNATKKDTNSTSNDTTTKLVDTDTKWNYTKIKDSNDVRSLSSTYGSTVNGFFLYERSIGNVPAETASLLNSCTTFTASDLANYDGGLVVIKNILKGNGAKYNSLEELSKSYTDKGSAATIIDIDGTKVLRVDDSGKGLLQSCKTGSSTVEKNIDFKLTYIALNKAGDEVFVALVDPYIANGGLLIDAAATTKTSSIFTEDNLKSEMTYILKNN